MVGVVGGFFFWFFPLLCFLLCLVFLCGFFLGLWLYVGCWALVSGRVERVVGVVACCR